MATDQTPPRNNLILFYSVASVLSLIALVPVFKSYFIHETEQDTGVKTLAYGGKELRAYRAVEKRRLESGPLPIERAMALLEQRGRAGSIVAPMPSTDMAARQGWMQLPQSVPPVTAPQEMPPAEGAAQPEGAPLQPEGAAPAGGAAAPGEGAAPAVAPTQGRGPAQLAPTGEPLVPAPTKAPGPNHAGAQQAHEE